MAFNVQAEQSQHERLADSLELAPATGLQSLPSAATGIQSLPPELISKIIIDALPDEWADGRPLSIILPASQVSHHFREVCLSTPRLWIHVVYRNDNYLADEIEALREHLRRSGDASLCIEMGDLDYFEDGAVLDGDDDCTAEVWRLLFAQSRRWRQALLVLNDRVPVPATYTQPLDVSMLERVALVYRAYGGNGLPELPVLCWFANAPALRRLAFTEPFSPSRVLAPWPRLTHLKITSSMPGSIRECVTILPLCKALEHFVAQMYKVEVEGTLPVVEVPTLRTMALRRDAYKIGHYLRAPRLNRLTIRSESAQSDLDTMVAIASRGPLLELHHLSVKDPSVDARR